MKINKLIAVFPVLLFSLNACVDIDVELKNYVDTYISTKVVNGDTLFALEAYAQSNYSIKTVEMKSPDSTNYFMKQIDWGGGVFEKQTKESDYSKIIPKTGFYSYSFVYHEHEPANTTNYLSEKVIYPIDSFKVMPTATNNSIQLKWKAAANADAYVVKIADSTSYVFISNYLDPKLTEATLNQFSKGWVNQMHPKPSTNYKYTITAILFEPGDMKFVKTQCTALSTEVSSVWPD